MRAMLLYQPIDDKETCQARQVCTTFVTLPGTILAADALAALVHGPSNTTNDDAPSFGKRRHGRCCQHGPCWCASIIDGQPCLPAYRYGRLMVPYSALSDLQLILDMRGLPLAVLILCNTWVTATFYHAVARHSILLAVLRVRC